MTQVRLVVGLAVLGAAVGWTVARVLDAVGVSSPGVPWSLPGAMVFLTAVLGSSAWFMYDRLRRKEQSVEANVAVRLLLLGKASALVGALVAGGYVGFGFGLANRFGGSYADGQVLRAFVTSGVAVLVVVGALLLERACTLPKDPDADLEEDDGDSGDHYQDGPFPHH